jgi:hypothetical protein
MKYLERIAPLKRGTAIFVATVLLCTQLVGVGVSSAQNRKHRRAPAVVKKATTAANSDTFERAAAAICEDRAKDPQGTLPIDIMASQPALPPTDARVVEGRRRAERLLPIAKRLVPLALSKLAVSYDLEAMSLNWIIARANSVDNIEVNVEAHDNAAWRPDEPRAITFGTVFLASLRSDEAMITVLAHELTHAINGTDQALGPLLQRVQAKASQIRGTSVGPQAAAELTSEMVGVQSLLEYSSRSPKGVTMRRRLARALGKDCVRQDLADANHFSPRETMRMLLRLRPELAGAIIGTGGINRSKKRKG